MSAPGQPFDGWGGHTHQPSWVPPVPVYPYAPWPRRVAAYLIDFAPVLVAQIPFWVGYVMLCIRLVRLPPTLPLGQTAAELTGSALIWMLIGLGLLLGALVWQWYNRWLTAGRTGQSLGKRVLDTTLMAEVNGQPIGPANAFLRDLLHVLDGLACIGFLRPLWDAKRQTFADLIMKTVVVDQRVLRASGPAIQATHGQHRPSELGVERPA